MNLLEKDAQDNIVEQIQQSAIDMKLVKRRVRTFQRFTKKMKRVVARTIWKL